MSNLGLGLGLDWKFPTQPQSISIPMTYIVYYYSMCLCRNINNGSAWFSVATIAQRVKRCEFESKNAYLTLIAMALLSN